MRVTLADSVYLFLSRRKRARPLHIQKDYCISRNSVHRALRELLKQGKVAKSGKVPKVYYRAVRNK